MQNIKVPKRTGNAITKYAYIDLINDSIKKITRYNLKSSIDLRGYENDNDRVQFKYGGTKCFLYGVWYSNINREGPLVLNLKVKADRGDGMDLYDLPIDIRDFRFKTLDRIAYEVYDYCKGAEDDDYETARRNYIANWMDSYREFML